MHAIIPFSLAPTISYVALYTSKFWVRNIFTSKPWMGSLNRWIGIKSPYLQTRHLPDRIFTALATCFPGNYCYQTLGAPDIVGSVDGMDGNQMAMGMGS